MLIPVWLVGSDHPALAQMARRPVLIAVDELDLTMRGQVVDMSRTHAVLMPDSKFYLCKNVYIEISFRFEATRYTLAGSAVPGLSDHNFHMDFDTVSRKTIQGLDWKLQSAGLLNGTPPPEVEPEQEEAVAPANEVVEKIPDGRRIRHEDPPDGIERRAHPRYEVEAYVRLTLVDEGRRLDCTMIDISLGGCRLFFNAPHELKQGLHVEVQFIGDGLPLRLAAVVQVCEYPQVVGLRYINVGARMQERLEWLVGEVAVGRTIAVPNR